MLSSEGMDAASTKWLSMCPSVARPASPRTRIGARRRTAALRHERRRGSCYDLCEELLRTRASPKPLSRAVVKFGERGVIDMIGVAGYFTTVL